MTERINNKNDMYYRRASDDPGRSSYWGKWIVYWITVGSRKERALGSGVEQSMSYIPSILQIRPKTPNAKRTQRNENSSPD